MGFDLPNLPDTMTITTTTAEVRLKPRKAQPFFCRHPWVRSTAIAALSGKPADGDVAPKNGDLYNQLMTKVKAAVGDKKPDSITFVWMQGERDAKEGHGQVYAASLAGLVKQLRDDLGRTDVNFVIGRLSDCRNGHEGWDQVRKAQVEVAVDHGHQQRTGLVAIADLVHVRPGVHQGHGGVPVSLTDGME